jgi:hypothetical protein
MASNSSAKGSGRACGDQWAAFDRLPKSFRETLANAAHPWAPSTILARHRRAVKGYRNPQEFKACVQGWDNIEWDRAAKRGLVIERYK